MDLKIERYPHAQYSTDTKLGFLVLYYPYDSVKKDAKEHATRLEKSPLVNIKKPDMDGRAVINEIRKAADVAEQNRQAAEHNKGIGAAGV